MVSPDWESLAIEKFYDDFIEGQKEFSQYFGEDGKRNNKNRIFNITLAKQNKRLAQSELTRTGKVRKRADINRYAAVMHANDMLEAIQNRLIEEKKVVKYSITRKDGTVKEIVRNNIRYSKEELESLRTGIANRQSYKTIAKNLGRTKDSVRRKYQKLYKNDYKKPKRLRKGVKP